MWCRLNYKSLKEITTLMRTMYKKLVSSYCTIEAFKTQLSNVYGLNEMKLIFNGNNGIFIRRLKANKEKVTIDGLVLS